MKVDNERGGKASLSAIRVRCGDRGLVKWGDPLVFEIKQSSWNESGCLNVAQVSFYVIDCKWWVRVGDSLSGGIAFTMFLWIQFKLHLRRPLRPSYIISQWFTRWFSKYQARYLVICRNTLSGHDKKAVSASANEISAHLMSFPTVADKGAAHPSPRLSNSVLRNLLSLMESGSAWLSNLFVYV